MFSLPPQNMKVNRIVFLICILLLSRLSASYGQEKSSYLDSIRIVNLGEVVVTAVQPDIPGTSSVIGREAVRHIQATELSGLSQLLPGVLTRNPDLNMPAAFTIRSVSYNDATNAVGTGILVDGLRMNNNMNMQLASLDGGGKLFNSSALSGYDVRALAPSSIESVEVIRGVPSARYGDVTSGVVLVKSRAGVQPYTMGLRFTVNEKLASLGKGMRLGTDGGALYVGADYALSTQDARLPEGTFRRFGLQAAYSKDFPKATLRLHLRGYHMQDKDKQGVNRIEGEYQLMRNQELVFSMNGRWNTGKAWLTNLEYNAGVTFGSQKNRSNTYYSGTRQVVTYATQAGEHTGIFLPPNYFAPLSVEGKPLSANLSLIANLVHSLGRTQSHLSVGLETGVEGNLGKGVRFNPSAPPVEWTGVRVRSYRDIPLVRRSVVFAEEKVTLPVGSMRTDLQAGVRFSSMHTRSLRCLPIIEPRLNIRQVLWKRNEGGINRSFSIRAGWGLLRKMPLLTYLYPDKYYKDENCFTYNDAETGYRLAVMNTFVADNTFNPELKLPVNSKWEIGANLNIRNLTVDVVWFREHLRDGYSTALQAEPFSYRRYSPLTDKGEKPVWSEEGLMNGGQPVPYTVNTTFALYRSPGNGVEQWKEGIEYTLNWGGLRCLRSSFVVSGSYIRMKEKNNALTAYHPQVETEGKPYPYVGIYEATGLLSNVQYSRLGSSRFQCITQIPRIGLVSSLTLQAVWVDKQRRGMESNYGNPVYLADENGDRIEGDPLQDAEHRKRLLPIYYLDGEGNRHRFTAAMAKDKQFADLILDAGSRTVFQEDSFGPYFLLNFRLTKKIGRYVSVAFCANNLTRSKPKRWAQSSRQYILLNPDLYYGVEMNIEF